MIPAKSLGEGYYALANLDVSSGEADTVEEGLCAAVGDVVTGMVSRAIRTTEEVRKGDFAGFTGKRILTSAPDAPSALLSLCEALSACSYDVILVFTGQDAGDPEALKAQLEGRYPRSEVIVQAGGQPVYDYILVLF